MNVAQGSKRVTKWIYWACRIRLRFCFSFSFFFWQLQKKISFSYTVRKNYSSTFYQHLRILRFYRQFVPENDKRGMICPTFHQRKACLCYYFVGRRRTKVGRKLQIFLASMTLCHNLLCFPLHSLAIEARTKCTDQSANARCIFLGRPY